MAALTQDMPRTFRLTPNTQDEWEAVADASAVIHAGAACVRDTTDGGPIPYSGTGTSGFAGFALDGATTGEWLRLRRRGQVEMAVTGTVAQSSMGALVYATSDNDFTLTSTDNLPIGKIVGIVATGALAVNKVLVEFEADTHTSR